MAEASPRTAVVSARFSLEEVRDLDELAAQKRMGRTECLRSIILKALATKTTPPPPPVSPELAEIVGVRLLVVNLLKPILLGKPPLTAEEFSAITTHVKATKKIVAAKVLTGETG